MHTEAPEVNLTIESDAWKYAMNLQTLALTVTDGFRPDTTEDISVPVQRILPYASPKSGVIYRLHSADQTTTLYTFDGVTMQVSRELALDLRLRSYLKEEVVLAIVAALSRLDGMLSA